MREAEFFKKTELMFLNILEEARFTVQGWHRPFYAGKTDIDFGSSVLESKNNIIKDQKPVTMWSPV